MIINYLRQEGKTDNEICLLISDSLDNENIDSLINILNKLKKLIDNMKRQIPPKKKPGNTPSPKKGR